MWKYIKPVFFLMTSISICKNDIQLYTQNKIKKPPKKPTTLLFNLLKTLQLLYSLNDHFQVWLTCPTHVKFKCTIPLELE